MKGTKAHPHKPAVRARCVRPARFPRAAVFGLFWLTAAMAQAATPTPYTISVPVIDVEPVLHSKTVEHPVRQCREVMVERRSRYHQEHRRDRHREPNTFVPGLLGGLVGGLIGNQFGGGSGKKALTVFGALAGSSIAKQSARERYRRDYHQEDLYRSEPERVCTTHYESETVEEVTGYDVTYEYGGQLFSKRTTYHPGDRLRVRVEVSPEPVTDGGRG